MKRGMMTDEIKEKSKQLLGFEITQGELRLMAYIQYVMMNDQRIVPIRINESERTMLSRWRKQKFITGGASDMTMTKKFWDAMNEILWLGYVNFQGEMK